MGKDFIGNSMRIEHMGGTEPGRSRFDQNFWRLGGMAGIAYSFGRAGFVIGVLGIGFGLWKDHQLDSYIANRPVQVYVAERDANGIIRPMFGAERPYSPQLADVDAFLRNWIKDARWVSPDHVRMGDSITQAYAALDDVPKAQLTEHFNKHNPSTLAAAGVSRSIQPLGATLIGSTDSQTYRLDWIEYQTEGARELPPVQRTANFVVVHRAPKSQEEYSANPSGIYITSVDSEVFRAP